VLFGLHVRGSLFALCAVDLAFVVWLIGLSFAAVAIAGTFQQLLAISNMGAIVLAGVGGALTPISTLPGWAEAIAPATPTYWAMRGFNGVILEGHSLAAEGKPIAILLGSAIAFFLLGALRFRFDAPKGGTL
jgi:ABC-2 type transport system permease protein